MGLFRKNSSVIELTSGNFDKRTKKVIHPLLDKGSKGLVMFSASWCGHCQRTAPELEKVADCLGTSFPVFYFDCEKYPEFARSVMKIEGYPTLKFIDRNGSLYKTYNSERTYEGFLAAICDEASICK
jgi:protein disulfide-isomerase A6